MSKKILIVEDNDLNLKFFRDFLEAHGYTIVHTMDGREALALIREHGPDLILMDIQLPGVSGLEVAKWIKADEAMKSIPVVAVTAHAMVGDAEEVYGKICDAYLFKPIPGSSLLQTIERFLG